MTPCSLVTTRRRCRISALGFALIISFLGFAFIFIWPLQLPGNMPRYPIDQVEPKSGSNLKSGDAAPASDDKNMRFILSSTALDEMAIKSMFRRLVLIAQKYSGPYWDKTPQMMTHQLPLINTSHWKLHSPSGRRVFSIAEVQRAALESAGEGNSVPNFAHYVLPFFDTNLQFHHMVSLLSCLHVMRPTRLLLWYVPGRLPQGEWWQRVRKNLTDAEWERRVVMVQREEPQQVYTVPVSFREHKSDVMRLEAIIVFGGIYFDMDVVVLKPLEPLRRRKCTIGREMTRGLCNGVLVAAPNATFLAMWHTAYQVFNKYFWGDHSILLPHSMNEAFPGLCHVEEESMHRPNWTPQEVAWIYDLGLQHRWNWRQINFVLHLWFRKYGVQHDMENIKNLDSMYGEICRFILYGETNTTNNSIN